MFDFFCSLVRRWPSGTHDPSSVNPWCGDYADFFDQLADRYGTNLSSRDRQYNRFWRQLSNDVIVSLSVRDHCFGARWEAAITTHSWAIMRYPSVKVRVHENIWHHQGSDLCIVLYLLRMIGAGKKTAATTPIIDKHGLERIDNFQHSRQDSGGLLTWLVPVPCRSACCARCTTGSRKHREHLYAREIRPNYNVKGQI